MTDFSHLKQLEITGTAQYPLTELEGCPILIVKPSGETNKEYFNALLRATGAGKRQKKRKVDAAMVSEIRNKDKALYPQHVIVGWEGMKDANGDGVPFSSDAASDFIAQLPDWVFDGIRAFCGEPESFIEDIIDVEEQAGN